MKTVAEVSRITGVSVRTLHHYDSIGLLPPTAVTEAGYRLYDGDALERLYLILIFRELGLPLKQIRDILDAPDFDRNRVLEQQIRLLQTKQAHLQSRIHLAQAIKQIGADQMNLKKYDQKKIDEYSAQAEVLYGRTDAYRQYKEKSRSRSRDQENDLGAQVMEFFAGLGKLRGEDPGSEAVQKWVRELQTFFTEHYYECTPQILQSLGQMYTGGGSMTENIDAAGGKGTAELAGRAIEIYCRK